MVWLVWREASSNPCVRVRRVKRMVIGGRVGHYGIVLLLRCTGRSIPARDALCNALLGCPGLHRSPYLRTATPQKHRQSDCHLLISPIRGASFANFRRFSGKSVWKYRSVNARGILGSIRHWCGLYGRRSPWDSCRSTESLISARSQVRHLLADADDLAEREVESVDAAQALLNEAWHSDTALQLLLLTIDPAADAESRSLAGRDLEELLASEPVYRFVRDRLYAAPLPAEILPFARQAQQSISTNQCNAVVNWYCGRLAAAHQ